MTPTDSYKAIPHLVLPWTQRILNHSELDILSLPTRQGSSLVQTTFTTALAVPLVQ